MDKKLIEYKETGKKEEAVDLLLDTPDKDLKTVIENRAVRGRGDAGALLRAIFYGSAPGAQNAGDRRMLVFKVCIHLLQANDLTSKVAAEIIGILLVEIDAFPASCLVELISIYEKFIKDGVGASGKSLELFPKLLSAVATQDSVNVSTGETTGAEYKSHVLNNLTSGRWDVGSVIHLATMFRDIPLTSDELKFIIVKIVRMFPEMDLQELPPLIYQMLLLSTKGHKKILLEGVMDYFVEQDKSFKKKKERDEASESMDFGLVEDNDNSDQLRHVEGTIILHVTFAIKQDQDLGREFIKYLKAQQQCNTSTVLAPFNVALALSMARIHRFEDPIMDLLKATVLKTYKDMEKRNSSAWVHDLAAESCDVESLLLDTAHSSVYGWDHVSQGLVQLGFTLMDSFGPKPSFGKILANTPPPSQQNPTQKACQLGATVLKEIFKVQEMVRAEILEQILNRVITKATTPVSHYIDLLANTVRAAPQILLDSLPKIREAFDYLSYLPPPTATGLMTAMQPLMKLSMSLKDGLMLTLRKAMFSKQLESRKIAVSGFLMLLSRFRILGGLPMSQSSQSISSSQFSYNNSVDIHQPYNASMNEAVCLEILGTLRRALGQQGDVRLTLYEGLFDVLCKNAQLGPPIIGMLFKQFKIYYQEKTDIQPPVKLMPCLITQGEEVSVGEPLAHLLVCLVACYLKCNGEETNECDDQDNGLNEVEDVLESMTRRLIKSDLEDFDLDSNADFSTNTGVGLRNNIFAVLTTGCYEALIEYNFTITKFEPASMQNVIQLFGAYHRVADLHRDKAGGAGGKRGKSAAPTTKSLLSLGCVTSMLHALYGDVIPEHEEGAGILRANPQFGRFVLSVVHEKLRQIDDRGTCDGAHGQNTDKIFSYCTEIAKITTQYYTSSLQTPDAGNRERSKVASSCLDCLSTATHVIYHRYQNRLAQFLRDIDGAVAPDLSDEDQVHKHVKKFQRIAVSVIASTDEDRSIKEAIQLFNIIGWLSHCLTNSGSQCAQVQAWAKKIASEQVIEDGSVVKSLLNLLFSLTVRQSNIALLLREFSQDIHRELGDIDQEIELTNAAHFMVVTAASAAPLLLQVITQTDHELNDTEFVITHIKARLTSPTAQGESGATQRESHIKGICIRLGYIINLCHELTQSAVPVGNCIDNLVKIVSRTYEVLTLFVKYHLALYACGIGGMSQRFEKLVRLSANNLTPMTYAMITYIQMSQSQHLQETTEKRKKKDKQISSALAAANKAKVLKETRFIPNLIFAIEQYEKFLIQLTKKSKINVMEHVKLGTSRDFRINTTNLTAALNENCSESESDNNDENSGDETHNTTENDISTANDNTTANDDTTANDESASEHSDQENAPPPNKRAKPSPPPPKTLKRKGLGKKSLT